MEETFYFDIMVVIDRKNKKGGIIQEGYLLYFSTSFVYMFIVSKSSLRNATFHESSCMNEGFALFFPLYGGILAVFNIFISEPLFFQDFIL